jgi:putative glutamine amidotransferase
MNIAISMEMTQKLRDTWHAALNHEWYDFFVGHTIFPVCCHGSIPDLDSIDLVILAGGNDMADIRTWRDNHYALRDQFEQRLIDQAINDGVPVVGICRGFHFLNWTQGGTHRLMDDPYDSKLVQLAEFEVTCHHTIEIDRLAPGFEVLEKDAKGVIELVRHKQKRLLGVGWHPERAVNMHTRGAITHLLSDL